MNDRNRGKESKRSKVIAAQEASGLSASPFSGGAKNRSGGLPRGYSTGQPG